MPSADIRRLCSATCTRLAPYSCRNHLGEISGIALKLGEKLESGLYCKLTDKELKNSYVIDPASAFPFS